MFRRNPENDVLDRKLQFQWESAYVQFNFLVINFSSVS